MNYGGDGTYATPALHGALNNAALLKLPFIYVVENNLYHQYAHYSFSVPMKDIAEAAKTYGIPGRGRRRSGRASRFTMLPRPRWSAHAPAKDRL